MSNVIPIRLDARFCQIRKKETTARLSEEVLGEMLARELSDRLAEIDFEAGQRERVEESL